MRQHDDAADILLRDAPLAARSWNATDRTFEVVFSTGAGVERVDHRGAYIERLDLNQDWAGFRGAPVLNSHKRGDVGDIFGSVIAAHTVGGEARATIRMSTRPEAEVVVQDILDGHVRGVSVGYRVERWQDSTDNDKRVRTAVKWTPVELSLVAVPADPAAVIRSQEIMETLITNDPPIVDRAAINVEIRSIARTAGLPQTWTDAQIDQGASAEQASRAALVAMQERSAATEGIRVATAHVSGHDATDPAWRTRTIGEAIFSRMTGAAPSDAARPFAGLSTVEIARDCLRNAGLQTTGSPATIIERAMMSTSDLPAIMGDSVSRTMRQSYAAAPSGLKRVARQTTARDFRTKHRIQMSAAPTLEPVFETGEFRSGSFGDEEETYKLATFGRIVGLSRQALVNDDLGALADLTRRMGIAAAQFEAQFLVDLVEANALMSDGKAVFATEHGNIAASGATIEDSTLTAARLAMRSQKEAGGQLIDATPKFLVVPSALETLGQKTLTAIQAMQTVDVNPWSFLSLVVEPRLASATGWYLVADPATIDGLEYAYLEGESGPQIFSEIGFDVDGVRFKVRLDFGGAFVESRSWYLNAGV